MAITSVVGAMLNAVLASMGFESATAATLSLMSVGFMWGVALWWVSAARSNDILGNTEYAWIGFIPIVNLYLMFKRGKSAQDPALARYVGDPLLVIGAIVLASLAGSMTDIF